MPLILKGRGKKVITISSGMADTDFIRKYEIYPATPYAISKAGVNIVIAKFSALYASQGVLFLGICPGSVTTDSNNSENGEFLSSNDSPWTFLAPCLLTRFLCSYTRAA